MKLEKSYVGTLPKAHMRKGNLGLIFTKKEDGNYYNPNFKGSLKPWQIICDLSNGYLKPYKDE